MVVLEPRTSSQIEINKLTAGELVFDTTTSTIKYSVDGATYKTIASSELIGPIGINTTNPDSTLEINSSTGETLRLTYNDSNGSAVNYVSLNVSPTGELLLDATGNNVKVGADDNLVVPAHNGTDKGLILGNTLVTSTAQQLNYNKITSVGLAEANKALVLDSNKTIYGISSLDTLSLSLNGNPVLSSANELNYNYGVTAGTASASKVLVLDTSKNITGLNNLNSTGRLGVNTSAPDKQVEVNSATGDCLRLTYNDNNGSAITYTDFSVSSTGELAITPSSGSVNIPTHNGIDKGLKLNGTLVTSSAIELNYVDVTAIGTAQASKALVLDANKDIEGINTLNAQTVNIDGKLTVNATDFTLPKTNTTSITTLTWSAGTTPYVSNSFITGTWNSICWAPEISTYVAVSSSGTYGAIYSTNPRNGWSVSSTTNITGFGFNSVCWASSLGLFVGVGSNGSSPVATSPNGINWTTRAVTGVTLVNVCWSPQLGKLIAVSNTNKTVYTSTDAITWGSVSTSVTGNYTCCGWSPQLNLFVVYGLSGYSTSSNGTSWTSQDVYVDHLKGSWSSMAWSPELSMFAMVSSSGSNKILTSKNGTIWSPRYIPIDVPLLSVCWSSELSLFVAVANGFYENNIIVSPDGITWTLQRGITSSVNNHRAICWCPERSEFITASLNRIFYCTKQTIGGNDWNIQSSLSSTHNWKSITWSPELRLFVACSGNGSSGSAEVSSLFYSSDGINWTVVTPTTAITAGNWSNVVWGASVGKFVAVANSVRSGSTYIIYSSDGKTWLNSPYSGSLITGRVEWSSTLSLFVAVGNGLIVTSSDGITWTGRTNPNTGDLMTSINWASGINKFLITTNTTVVVTSSDGINWTRTSNALPLNAFWYKSAWSPELSMFVAVSSGNAIATSTDGTTWTLSSYTPPTDIGLTSVIWVPELSKFVVIGTPSSTSAPNVMNNIFVSSNGINWTPRSSPVSSLFTLCWAKELSLIVALALSSSSTPTSTGAVTSFDHSYFLTLPAYTSSSGGSSNILGTSMIVDYSGYIGINTNNPARQIEVNSATGECLRLTYNDSDGSAQNYTDLTVGSTGELTISPSGQKINTSDINTTGVNITLHNGVDKGLKLAGTLVTSTADELNYVDVTTIGTAQASKALVLDTSKNITGINNLNSTGRLGVNTSAPDKQVEINNTTGDCLRLTYNDSDGSAITYTDFSVSSTGELAITPSSGSVNIPTHNGIDKGLKLNGTLVTSSATELNYVDVTATGIAQANKSLVLDTNKDIEGINTLNAQTVNIDGKLTVNATDYTDPTTNSTGNSLAIEWSYAITSLGSGGLENSNSWKSVSWSPTLGMYVAITDSSSTPINQRIMYATNPRYWNVVTLNTPFTVNFIMNSIAWSPLLGMFVIVGRDIVTSGKYIAYSSNGTTWNMATPPANITANQDLSVVRWSPERSEFLALGFTNNYIVKSTDGINWTATTGITIGGNNITTLGNDLCWSPKLNLYVACLSNTTGNRIITSLNGTTWTNRYFGGDNNIRSICWSPELEMFAGVGYGGTGANNKVVTSYDGITWSIRYNPIDFQYLTIIWVAELGLFIASTNQSSVNNILTSSDGITWNNQVGIFEGSPRCMVWSPERYELVAPYSSRVAYSVKDAQGGYDFVRRATPTSNNWTSVCWSSDLNLFVSVSDNGTGDRVMTSSDGVNWDSRISGADCSWNSVIWAKELNMFIATANSGTGNTRIMTSSNGISWTFPTIPASSSLYSIAWSPTLNLLVATGNNMITSPDGINWTSRTLPLTGVIWTSIIWVPSLSKFLAVNSTATSNRVMMSSDGINWTLYSAVSGFGWKNVTYSPKLSLFVAVADNGSGNRFMTSTDGMTWASVTTLSLANNAKAWRYITWVPELEVFVASAVNATVDNVIVSVDGVNWVTSYTPHALAIYSISWAKELSMIVGVAGYSASTNFKVVSSFDYSYFLTLGATLDSTPLGTSMIVDYSGYIGINTNNPARQIEVNSATGECLRLTYNDPNGSAQNYTDLVVNSTGELSILSSGQNIYTSDISATGLNISNHNGVDKGLKLNGTLVTSSATELNYLDITTIGTAQASKALVLDTSKNIAGINDLNSTGRLGVNTSAPDKQVEINNTTGECLRLTYNDNNGSATTYADFSVNSTGELQLSPSGTNTIIDNLKSQVININGTTDAISISNGGTLTISGGTAIAKKCYIGDGVYTEINNNVGNNVSYPLTLTTVSNTTTSEGIATGLKYVLETPSNVNKTFGTNEIISTSFTDGNENGKYLIKLLSNGNLTERLSLSHDGILGNILYVNETSDRRVKENIIDADAEDSYNKIMDVRITDYNFIGKEKVHRGVIAQELREVIPSAIELEERGEYKDFHTVHTAELVGFLIQTVQYIDKKIKNLETVYISKK